MTAIIEYANGVLCTVHFNSESIINEQKHMEIYGSDGMTMENPNEFGSPVFLEKSMSEATEFPLTHEFQKNSRRIGAVEILWSILKNRPQCASMEWPTTSLFDKLYLEGYVGNGFEERVSV